MIFWLQGLIELHRAFTWEPAPFDDNRGLPGWRRGLAYNYTIESFRRSYVHYVLEQKHHTALIRGTSLPLCGS